MSKSNMTDFYEAAKPLMEYLKRNYNVNIQALVTSYDATLSETVMSVPLSAEMKNFYFTFGMNHVKEDGSTLYYNHVRIQAICESDARMKMFQARGQKWSFSYPQLEWEVCRATDKATGHVTTEIPLHEVVIQWDKKEP